MVQWMPAATTSLHDPMPSPRFFPAVAHSSGNQSAGSEPAISTRYPPTRLRRPAEVARSAEPTTAPNDPATITLYDQAYESSDHPSNCTGDANHTITPETASNISMGDREPTEVGAVHPGSHEHDDDCLVLTQAEFQEGSYGLWCVTQFVDPAMTSAVERASVETLVFEYPLENLVAALRGQRGGT